MGTGPWGPVPFSSIPEKSMNHEKAPALSVKIPLLFAFCCGLAVGFLAAALCFTLGPQRSAGERAASLTRNIDEAHRAQRDAEERALQLQTELARITAYAHDIENRARTVEERINSLTDTFGGAVTISVELGAGIERAQDSLETSRDLLTELGTILGNLQERNGTPDHGP